MISLDIILNTLNIKPSRCSWLCISAINDIWWYLWQKSWYLWCQIERETIHKHDEREKWVKCVENTVHALKYAFGLFSENYDALWRIDTSKTLWILRSTLGLCIWFWFPKGTKPSTKTILTSYEPLTRYVKLWLSPNNHCHTNNNLTWNLTKNLPMEL